MNEFVDNFNKISGSNSKMTLVNNFHHGDIAYKIEFDNKSIKIWLHIIDDTDVFKSQGKNVWNEPIHYETRPKLNDKPVFAWGGIETPSQKGMNIVLIASHSSEYGDWFVLCNTHGAMYRRKNNDNRSDPFVFTKNELINEIHHVNSTHIYNTTVSAFDIDPIIDFISDEL